MIDRESRDKLASVLRDVLDGKAGRAEFESILPIETEDRAVADTARLWYHYFILEQRDLRNDERPAMERTVLFLKTDLELEWPARGSVRPVLGAILGAMLLSFLAVFVWPHEVAFGALAVLGFAGGFYLFHWLEFGRWYALAKREAATNLWPFIRRSDYEKAGGKP